MAKHRFIKDAPPIIGICIFGDHWLSKEDAKELLEELKEKIKEWENPKPNCFDPEYPPGSKYGLIKRKNII